MGLGRFIKVERLGVVVAPKRCVLSLFRMGMKFANCHRQESGYIEIRDLLYQPVGRDPLFIYISRIIPFDQSRIS